jgi:hypothetical protein
MLLPTRAISKGWWELRAIYQQYSHKQEYRQIILGRELIAAQKNNIDW